MDRQFWISLIPLLIVNGGFFVALVYYTLKVNGKWRDKEIQKDPSSIFLNKWIREWWLWTQSPIENWFVKHQISPSLITMISLFLCLLSGLFYGLGWFGLAGWLFIFGGTCDAFDGRVARRTNQSTRQGGYLDSVLDRVTEGAVFFGLLYYYQNSLMFFITFMAFLGSIMVSYTKAQAEVLGLPCKVGPMQRPERIVWLGVSSVLSPIIAGLIESFVLVEYTFLISISLTIVAAATLYTAVYRFWHTYEQLKRDPSLRSGSQRNSG